MAIFAAILPAIGIIPLTVAGTIVTFSTVAWSLLHHRTITTMHTLLEPQANKSTNTSDLQKPTDAIVQTENLLHDFELLLLDVTTNIQQLQRFLHRIQDFYSRTVCRINAIESSAHEQNANANNLHKQTQLAITDERARLQNIHNKIVQLQTIIQKKVSSQ